MAIIIEEEKQSSGILNILGWLVVLAIAVGAIYYIFFVSPPPAVILPSATSKNIAPISQLSISAQSVIQGSEFQALQQYVVPTSTFGSVPVGRVNPFVSP